MIYPAEPFRIKAVEPVAKSDRETRAQKMAEAGYNTFLLESKDVYFDLLTDSGTSSLNARQWASMMRKEPSSSANTTTCELEETIRNSFGFKHVIPTTRGQGAESILAGLTISGGQSVLGNMCTASHRFHMERQGGSFIDVIRPEAYNTALSIPFKGNLDLSKLEAVIADKGADKIAYIRIAATVNLAGGQPVSLENMKAVRQLADQHQIKVFFDATHCIENAFFIQEQEPGYADKSIQEILLAMFSYADGCVINGNNKECLVSSGGILCLNDELLFEEATDMIMLYSGMPMSMDQDTQSMLSGIRQSIAVALRDSMEQDYIEHRVKQVRYLGEKLRASGVPVIEPIGGHAVFLDANRFCAHLPAEQLPAQSLTASLYIEAGIRAMERGVVSAGASVANSDESILETVRLAIPRQVYTYAHMDMIANNIVQLHQQREAIKGLKFSYEPKWLRFFNARFEQV
ncbi:tryptophanase [Vibrio panuliri]|uniref:Tyrosine phenol-lyase n=1 Tax=Vibrio panuliri TaxID=1381081 RepID=A0ABX3F624_9VIBR|nr:tryptophanase [Vibrio panuliri]KAB1454801.1 tryptophanase [Vibrio panuliri]OLQ85541.1 tyrosine phenol-lyase [Vibrio panuliri]